MKFRSQRWLRLILDVALSLIVALGLTVWMTAGERELNWQRACFSASGDWSVGDAPFWRFLYEFALVPVLLVCVAAVGALLGGFRWEILRRARRVAWFALALLALGPGLIANLWLKDHWGRPRPREITEFGGRWPYESVFGMDFTGEGKSFPCGHATMGFYFLGLWFLLRGVRPMWAWVSLVVALAWGGLIGFTRMVQGGHFATDSVWAAAVMWSSAAVLYRV
ncbi:MAG: phosphatase PAP2 family protein, partial [Verrucomicrobiae bacterium]|nr:phosphatase PAP2 family protein [Verrucomicrobiae bacterium]